MTKCMLSEARIKFLIPILILEIPITFGHEFCYGTMNHYIIVLIETLSMIQRSCHLDLIIPKMVLHEHLGFPCNLNSLKKVPMGVCVKMCFTSSSSSYPDLALRMEAFVLFHPRTNIYLSTLEAHYTPKLKPQINNNL